MNKSHLAFLLSVLLLLPGCVSNEYYKESIRGERTTFDFSHSEEVCATGDCICMSCGIATPPEPYSLFYNFSYAGKTCSFNPCNQDQYLEKIKPNPNRELMNFFMLGQGGFGDFGTANPFCNNSLRMPVKWLDTRNSGDDFYPLPEPDRATCFLEKGSIPVYILYSNGRSIDADRAREIAALFNGKGPVIITTEMGFDSSTSISEIRDQANFMKGACPNCLIALAPRLGDNSTEFDTLARDLAGSIDLFAFGISSRNSSSCDSASLYYEAVSYSEQLLYKYKKPSILAYVLLDKGWNDAKTCFWDDSLIASTYSDFYTYAPAFPSSGIIGVSLYSLSGVGSLPCEECGLVDSSGNPTPGQGAWFSQCQQAYASQAIIPLVFTDAPGTTCIFGPSSYNYAGTSFYTQAPPTQEPASAAPVFYKCDACAVMLNADKLPIKLSSSASGFSSSFCNTSPVLDSYADIRDLDPAFVRAIVWRESAFGNCVVAMEPLTGAECGRSKSTPLLSISDPDNEFCPVIQQPRSGEQVCAMGLMQTLIPPYDRWADTDILFPEQESAARNCGLDEEGTNKFNPFNPEHSACLGTFVLSKNMDAAKDIVRDNEPNLGLTAIKSKYGEDVYESSKGVLTLFIAGYKYGGVWDSSCGMGQKCGRKWMDDFPVYSAKDDSYCKDHEDDPCCSGGRVDPQYKNCCGTLDFVNFVVDDKCMELRGEHPSDKLRGYIHGGRSLLDKYMTLREKCGICNEKLWEDNLNAWAASSRPSAGG